MIPGVYVNLSVSDTGGGIDKEIFEKIFDPFFTTGLNEKKTGLGLSLVHGIVKGCGGCVRAHSTPGRGSRFDVYLPAGEDGPAGLDDACL